MKIILISTSLKKKYILENIGFNVFVNKSNIKETIKKNQNFIKSALGLTWRKVRIIANRYCQKFNIIKYPILSTKSVIICNNTLIKNIKNKEHLYHIIKYLQGQNHQIITAFSIIWLHFIINRIVVTTISLKQLNIKMIDNYISNQIWCKNYMLYNIYESPAILIENIYGSYSNIFGMPTEEILSNLHKIGYLKL